jgi:hypothetical protein
MAEQGLWADRVSAPDLEVEDAELSLSRSSSPLEFEEHRNEQDDWRAVLKKCGVTSPMPSLAESSSGSSSDSDSCSDSGYDDIPVDLWLQSSPSERCGWEVLWPELATSPTLQKKKEVHDWCYGIPEESYASDSMSLGEPEEYCGSSGASIGDSDCDEMDDDNTAVVEEVVEVEHEEELNSEDNTLFEALDTVSAATTAEPIAFEAVAKQMLYNNIVNQRASTACEVVVGVQLFSARRDNIEPATKDLLPERKNYLTFGQCTLVEEDFGDFEETAAEIVVTESVSAEGKEFYKLGVLIGAGSITTTVTDTSEGAVPPLLHHTSVTEIVRAARAATVRRNPKPERDMSSGETTAAVVATTTAAGSSDSGYRGDTSSSSGVEQQRQRLQQRTAAAAAVLAPVTESCGSKRSAEASESSDEDEDSDYAPESVHKRARDLGVVIPLCMSPSVPEGLVTEAGDTFEIIRETFAISALQSGVHRMQAQLNEVNLLQPLSSTTT